ncbi:MAG: glutamate--cysteine ligase, partial [Kribbellaceae bacterium]|nr:glutamate--cysteine ligase [Kribbellaceae bacterium]
MSVLPGRATFVSKMVESRQDLATTIIGSRVEAEGFVAMVCFKHGPPRLHGVELEWTVHYADDPRRPLDATVLSKALGVH